MVWFRTEVVSVGMLGGEDGRTLVHRGQSTTPTAVQRTRVVLDPTELLFRTRRREAPGRVFALNSRQSHRRGSP